MKKLAVFALLGLLCLSNAALDYAAFCTFLDVNPFPLFQDFGADGGGGAGSQTMAILISLAQALLLLALPSVAARKLAANDKAACIVCLSLAGLVATFAATLRAVTEAGAGAAGIDGSSMGVSPSLVCFCLIMLAAAGGEAVLSFLYETIKLKQAANSFRAQAERIQLMEEALPEHVAAATDIAIAAAKQSAAAASAGNEAVFQELLGKSGELQNAFIGYVSAIDSTREAAAAVINGKLERFEANLKNMRDSHLAKLQARDAAAGNAGE